MKVTAQTVSRLRLEGIPVGAGWMAFSLVLGLIFTVAFGLLSWRHFRAEGFCYEGVMCGLGAALGQLFFWMGLVTLLVGRESLELDRQPPSGVRGGRYRSRSPIVTVQKPFDFDLTEVHAVSLEHYTERTPGGGKRGGGTMEVCRARLLIKKPCRAITLDETSNHQEARVMAVARCVADFLGAPVEESDRRKD